MRFAFLSVPLTTLCAAVCVAGCVTPTAARARGGATGADFIDEKSVGYWVWREGDLWRLRTSAAGHAHRFQGSVEGLTGGIVEVRIDDGKGAELREQVAQVGNSVQFDYDAGDFALRGFDARVTGGCLRFDLLLDGKRHPERVRFGRRGEPPRSLPVERCP